MRTAILAFAIFFASAAAAVGGGIGFERATVSDSDGYQALAPKPEYHVVPDAGHFVFIACSGEMTKRAPAICGDAPTVDRAAIHQTFNSAVVNFFRTHL